MTFLRELDEEETAKRVLHFFDNEWMTFVRVSGINISSPSFSDMPSSGTRVNMAELKELTRLDAKDIVQSAIHAMDVLDEKHSTIMKCRYVWMMSWNDTYQRTTYTERHGRRILKVAACQFAEAFAPTYDFRVFKNVR